MTKNGEPGVTEQVETECIGPMAESGGLDEPGMRVPFSAVGRR